MPIQINGTTVIDEANFADKNLSNLSEAGLSVIINTASSAGTNYMKKINTKNGSYGSISSDSSTFTTPSDGWIILQHTENNAITLNVGSSGRIIFKEGDKAVISCPVCSGTVFSRHLGTGSVSYIFFPEVS